MADGNPAAVDPTPHRDCRFRLLLPALLRHSLPRELLAETEAHLEACAACAAVLDDQGAESFDLQFGTRARAPDAPRPEEELGDLAEQLAPAGMFATEILSCTPHSVVLKAWDAPAERWAAVKVLGIAEAGDPVARRRFQAEAATMAAFPHPHIVQVREVGVAGGRPFIAMEYIAEGSLSSRIQRDGPFEAPEAARIVRQLCLALAPLHRAGAIHRDLKPGNVLAVYGPAGVEPKLADFGIALRFGTDAPLTEHGHACGTPQYMAPEQLCGPVPDASAASDVYSLGAMLFELVAGVPAFEPGPSRDLAVRKSAAEFAIPPQCLEEFPAPYRAIMLRCLRRHPAERYPDAAALGADLAGFLEGRRLAAETAALPNPGPLSPRLLAFGAAVLAALALFALVAHLLLENAALRRQLGQ